MRRALAAVVTVGVVAAGLVGLAELTQNRPDPERPGTATELTLQVRTRGGFPPALAGQGLWGTCQQTVEQARLRDPATDLGGGRLVLVVEPALGRHAVRRLTGCLEDATVPRVTADLVGRRDLVLR